MKIKMNVCVLKEKVEGIIKIALLISHSYILGARSATSLKQDDEKEAVGL